MKTKMYVLAFIIINSMLFGHIPYALSAELVNIAPQYGIASADATWSERPVENAIDADYVSHWSAGSFGTLSNPHWWKVDLQQNWQVSEIIVNLQLWTGSPYLGYTNDYNLYVSSDGSSWTLIGSGTIAEHTDPDAYSDTYILSDQMPPIRYVKYEVVGGTHWADLGEMEVKVIMPPACDFSIEPNIERCFGGIGVQCQGIPVFAEYSNDPDNCLVTGWMSVGSILHDRCCVATNNAGYSCSGLNQGNRRLCRKEWQEAWDNTQCTALGAVRQWPHTWGPYPTGNTGDDTNADIRALVGSRVNPAYQGFCPSGKCQVNAKGKTIIKWDQCGRYCECQ